MKCKIVAELSCNHRGSLERALELVDLATTAGADAVKVQSWTPGTMVLDQAFVLRSGPWAGTNLSDLYEEAYTPWEWHKPIFDRAAAHQIQAFASVFDVDALIQLQDLGCELYKVASFEIVDIPLIRAIALTRKPMVLSTGMATREEIDQAVRAALESGARDVTLLKCTSAYPATAADAHLATMMTMKQAWCCPVGLSDHTPGIGVAVTAAALGATMIEKHFTKSRAEGGPDAAFSLEPAEFAALVREVRNVEGALGQAQQFGPTEQEKPQRDLRRSLYFAQDLPAGVVLDGRHLATARPAMGLSPRFYGRVVGTTLKVGVRRGQPVTWDVVAGARTAA